MNRDGMSRRSLLAATGAVIVAGVAQRKALASTDDPTANRQIDFEDSFSQLDWSVWNAGPKAGTFDTGFYGRSAFARRSGEQGFIPYEIVDDPRAENGKALQISAKYIGSP